MRSNLCIVLIVVSIALRNSHWNSVREATVVEEASSKTIHPAMRARLYLPVLDLSWPYCSSGVSFYFREWGTRPCRHILIWITLMFITRVRHFAVTVIRIIVYPGFPLFSDQCFQNEHVLLFEFLRLITGYRRNIRKTVTHILHTSPLPRKSTLHTT